MNNKERIESEGVNRTKKVRFYPFVFTGKDPRKGRRIPLKTIKYNEQRDEETGYGYFGARYMDHELLTSFLSVDRYASKYPFISPYVYCTWNPIRLIDPTGDTIVIMGGNDTKVYYSPGMKYSGSDGFVKQTVSALNTLNGTDEGAKIISGLHTSNNTFSIHEAEDGGDCFKPSDGLRAYAKQYETDPSLKEQYEYFSKYMAFSGGSGGDVYWYPGGTWLPIIDGEKLGVDVCPVTDLGHELSHAFDANLGLMDRRIHHLNEKDKIGVSRNDWNAVYRENLMRQQLNKPLRTHYHKRTENNLLGIPQVTGGDGPFMLKNGKPYLPNW